jgi:hypothetical protein
MDGQGRRSGQRPEALEHHGDGHGRALDHDRRRCQETGEAVGLEQAAVVGVEKRLVEERSRKARESDYREREKDAPTDNGAGPHTYTKLVYLPGYVNPRPAPRPP